MSVIKWRAKSRLFFTLVLLTPFLCGCWDRLEVEQRAAVLGISIDMAEQGAQNHESDSETGQADATASGDMPNPPMAGMLRLSAQIAVPGRIPLGPGESGGGGGGSPAKTVWLVHADGKGLEDALQQLQQKMADRLFLGHLRVIVVSEAFAKQQGLRTVTDTLRRNPEVRRTAWLVISKGKAVALMATSPPLERVPTLYLLSTMDHARQMGKLSNDFLGVFASRLTMKGREPVLPYLEVERDENVNTAGLAFFKGDKMISTTKKTFDISTYMQLAGIRHGGYALIVNVPGQSGTVMWQAYRRQRKISVDIRQGRPHFTVDVHVDGNILGKSGEQFSIDDPTILRAIDNELVRRGREQLNELIDQTKKDDTDVVGFGEYVRARQRAYWDRNIKTKEKWEEMYPQISVDTHIQVKTRRVGMQGK